MKTLTHDFLAPFLFFVKGGVHLCFCEPNRIIKKWKVKERRWGKPLPLITRIFLPFQTILPATQPKWRQLVGEFSVEKSSLPPTMKKRKCTICAIWSKRRQNWRTFSEPNCKPRILCLNILSKFSWILRFLLEMMLSPFAPRPRTSWLYSLFLSFFLFYFFIKK